MSLEVENDGALKGEVGYEVTLHNLGLYKSPNIIP